jgi:hypothetical protein
MSDKVIANERRRSHRAAGQGDYALHEAFLEAARERDDAHNEIERLRARVAELECVLRDARHNGLIYWEPQTTRGAVQRANMMSRIDIVLNKEAKP